MSIARDELDEAAFDAMMGEGLAQAKTGQGRSLDEAFSLLHKSIWKIDYYLTTNATR